MTSIINGWRGSNLSFDHHLAIQVTMAQPGQDAKFFQRGKIEVIVAGSPLSTLYSELDYLGIPLGATSTRLERQEVREAQDSLKEDRG